MNSQLWSTIRRMFLINKLSKRAIAVKLKIHRDTVSRALESVFTPPVNKPRGRLTKGLLEPFKTYIIDRLKEYPNLTASKLLMEIQKQGYGGGYTILKDYIRQIRAGKNPTAFLRLETQPGEYAQVDWANIGHIAIGNSKRQLSCFVMALSYSRMMYIEFTLSQRIEDFMAAHVNAFRFFGGIPKRINYDNLKTVVLAHVGTDIRFNLRFMDFAGYYLFKPVICAVRKPNEKGKVESGIKYVRSAFLAGRLINSQSQIQNDALEWLDKEANVRIHQTTREKPVVRFESEKNKLLDLPPNDYDCSIIASAMATSQALVHFDGNRYSVPCAFAGKTLTIKANARQVAVYDKARILTSHRRSYEKHLIIENPRHYEGLLKQRKKARMTKLVESFLGLSADCEKYLKGLVSAELNLQSQLEKIRNMANLYGKSDVINAINHALGYKAFGAHYIQSIILQQRAARNMPEPQQMILSKKPQWANLAVEETDMKLYDELFEQDNEDNE